MVLLAVIVGAGYVGLRGLNAAYAKPERDARTLAALQKAKQALLGYAANQVRQAASQFSVEVTGALPCPALDLAGLPATDRGKARMGCSPTSQRIGRLPWLTLQLPELTDANGHELWYAVSEQFRHVCDFCAPPWPVTPTPRVNLRSQGAIQLSFNGEIVQQRVVAVVFAPGPPVPGQTRATAAQRDNVQNYLERFTISPPATPPGSVDLDVHVGPASLSPAFNDVAITITEQELFDAIAGALVERVRRDIVPLLTAHALFYNSFPAPTALFNPAAVDPSPTYPGGGLAGSATSFSGHLPVAEVPVAEILYSNASITPGTATVDCVMGQKTAPLGDDTLTCNVSGSPGDTFTVRATLAKVNAGVFEAPVLDAFGVTATATGAPVSGTVNAEITVTGRLDPSFNAGTFSLYTPRQVLNAADPQGLTVAPPQHAWFMYPGWAKFFLYVRCSNVGTACVTVTATDGTASAGRAALVFVGRPIQKAMTSQLQDQSLSSLDEYLEPPNNVPGTTIFMRGIRTASFNDRVVAVP